jgi:hypothetical protein
MSRYIEAGLSDIVLAVEKPSGQIRASKAGDGVQASHRTERVTAAATP